MLPGFLSMVDLGHFFMYRPGPPARNGAAHSGPRLHTWINNQVNAPCTYPHIKLMEAIPWGSQMSLTCVK